MKTHQLRQPHCRLCGAPLSHTFIDLGLSPLANALVSPDNIGRGEFFSPLHVWICDRCFLVQIEEIEAPAELFGEYRYFSSYSTSWLQHAEKFAGAMIARFGLDEGKRVVEIASNDGYLLQYFASRGIPTLGIEPARNIAEIARERGVPTREMFFGAEAAASQLREGYAADLMPANNVLAHVPDLIDFLEGFRILLKPEGVATFEFPHLLRLIEERQFDTIYHEHFSYLSLSVVCEALRRCGLRAFDVEELPTHGGSLRVFACRAEAGYSESGAVADLLDKERAFGLLKMNGYDGFSESAARIKYDSLEFLIRARRDGKTVCGYAVAAKGATFLNYCGIGPEFVQVVADRSPYKQGCWLPGCRIPIVAPEALIALRPDYVLILAWNLKREIASELDAIRAWGGKFVTAIPQLEIF